MISRCRECGCTDDDCQQCIERTGHPCTWADDMFTLCSACEDRPAVHEVADAIAAAAQDTAPELALHRTLAVEVLLLVAERGRERVKREELLELLARVGCWHCKQEVGGRGDDEALRRHAMVCPASPMVQRAAKLVDLVERATGCLDALSDRAARREWATNLRLELMEACRG